MKIKSNGAPYNILQRVVKVHSLTEKLTKLTETQNFYITYIIYNMRYLYCFAVVNSFVVQQADNNQIENSLTETLTTMVSLSNVF